MATTRERLKIDENSSDTEIKLRLRRGKMEKGSLECRNLDARAIQTEIGTKNAVTEALQDSWKRCCILGNDPGF